MIDLKEVLKKHNKWLNNEEGGEQADLRRANLSGADLYGANLRGANLRRANLYGADLRGADLRRANLYGANLRGANLRGANLSGADLYGANLSGADLRGADLRGADLSGADLSGVNLYGAKNENEFLRKHFPICCPEYGAFIGWKKARGKIVKLEITEDAKRSSAFGRKCRCSEARCLEIQNIDGSNSGLSEVYSNHDPSFIYRVGEIAKVDDFDEDRKNECASGIHFFITRQEAVDY